MYICLLILRRRLIEWTVLKYLKKLIDLYVDWKNRRLLQDLYMRQESLIRVEGGDSDPGIVGRGVRQGCRISPLLFLIYAEVMMIKIYGRGRVGGKTIR